MIDQAFVLGAGLGTRLRPLTDDLPKPLVPIFQKPLITFAFDHLMAAGIRSFVVNTHHLPNEFEQLFGKGYRESVVRLIHEPVLLETGGGMKNVEQLLHDKPFVVYSGDVVTDLLLAPLIEEHFRRDNDVTLALRETGLAREMAFRDGRVIDIGNLYGEAGNYDYANVSVWSPRIFDRLSLGKIISFIPVLAEWIGAGGKIGGVVLQAGEWFNLGSPTQYLDAHRAIKQRRWRPAYVQPAEWPRPIAADAEIANDAQVCGFSSIGSGCRVGVGALVEDSILWAGAQVAPQAKLTRCVVRRRRIARGELADTII